MRRIAIALVLSGLLAACGQRSQPAADGGAQAPLDYIDAVPIDENAPAPVAEPQPVARKDEPEKATRTEEKPEEAEAPAPPAPEAPPSPDPAEKADDAAEATRRANGTTATPDAAPASETPSRPD